MDASPETKQRVFRCNCFNGLLSGSRSSEGLMSSDTWPFVPVWAFIVKGTFTYKRKTHTHFLCVCASTYSELANMHLKSKS